MAHNEGSLFVYDLKALEGTEHSSYLEANMDGLSEDALVRLMMFDADVYNRVVTCDARREIFAPNASR
jgi:hypothetical protein